VGDAFAKDEAYSLNSDLGAILLILESDDLNTNERAFSTPERIAGQTGPSDQGRHLLAR
jgi:hypothetical protein